YELRRRFSECTVLPLGRDARGVQASIVDRDGCLCRDCDDHPLVSLGKDGDLRMAEKESTMNFTSPRNDWHREVAPDRQMAGGHSVVGSALPVPRVLRYVVRSNGALARERWCEHVRISGHGKA